MAIIDINGVEYTADNVEVKAGTLYIDSVNKGVVTSPVIVTVKAPTLHSIVCDASVSWKLISPPPCATPAFGTGPL